MNSPETHPLPPNESPIFGRRPPLRVLVPAVVAILLGLACLPFAEALQPIIKGGLENIPMMGKLKSAAKDFPNLFTILAVFVVVWRLDPKKRHGLGIFLVAILISSVINESIKQVTGRGRPEVSVELDEDGREDLREVIEGWPHLGFEEDKSDKWLGPRLDRPFLNSQFASFPSGHSNSGMVFAAWLSAMYPQARVVFILAGASCAASRVIDRRHWPGDALVGAGLGWLVAQWIFALAWPVRFGYWFESRLGRIFGGRPRAADPQPPPS